MSRAEKGPKPASNSKLSRSENQSSSELDSSQKEIAFQAALSYADELVEARLDVTGLKAADRDALLLYKEQSDAVKKYLNVAVVSRLSSYCRAAVEGGIAEADSILRFAELKKRISKALRVPEKALVDSSLQDLIAERSNMYIDGHFGQMGDGIKYVQRVIGVLAPRNPSGPQAQRSVSQQALD